MAGTLEELVFFMALKEVGKRLCLALALRLPYHKALVYSMQSHYRHSF